MNINPAFPPDPSRPVTDRDRQLIVEQIQRAMAEDIVPFEELDDRFAAVYAARTRADLDAVVVDLPAPPPPAPATLPRAVAAVSYSMFGDVKVGGWIAIDSDLTYGSGFGDITLDLSSAHLATGRTVRARSIFGDVTVILPDGIRTSLTSVTVFGSRREDLAPPVPGAPEVRVVVATLFGDARLYSLSRVPEGPFRRLWKALRGR